LGNSFASGFM